MSTRFERSNRQSEDDDFIDTEFYLDWREPLPAARRWYRGLVWSCIACAAALAAWLARR